MKGRKYSQVWFLIGLALGLCALWGASAPVGLCGDLIVGSWTDAWGFTDGLHASGRAFCYSGTQCNVHMNATSAGLLCSDGPTDRRWLSTCYGGSFIGATYYGAGMTVHTSGAGTAGCYHPDGSHPQWQAYCADVSDAAFW